MFAKPGKNTRVDVVTVLLLGAVGVAVGCSMMLGAAGGGREPEMYDNPLEYGKPRVVVARPAEHFVKVAKAPRDEGGANRGVGL